MKKKLKEPQRATLIKKDHAAGKGSHLKKDDVTFSDEFLDAMDRSMHSSSNKLRFLYYNETV